MCATTGSQDDAPLIGLQTQLNLFLSDETVGEEGSRATQTERKGKRKWLKNDGQSNRAKLQGRATSESDHRYTGSQLYAF